MPTIPVKTTLNASSMDIINTIRDNLPDQYANLIPVVTTERDIIRVGAALMGDVALKNEFLGALINRIAKVIVDSATFNNPWRVLKKGVLDYGEMVEEIFVGLVKPLKYSADKAAAREFKRYIPDIKSAFHVINYRVIYPLTIQPVDIEKAFLNASGVENLINRLIESILTSYEYDEYLLMKYLIIIAVAEGQVKVIPVSDGEKEAGIAFKSTSGKLMFPSTAYNAKGVTTTTPKSRQIIIMSSDFDAAYDVNVLAAAFHMDKAEFTGRRLIVDDWTTFDNDRFSEIRAESEGLREITEDDLAEMAKVKAILVDENWFQLYDEISKMTNKYVAAGDYNNYFYHVQKTISSSPFSNFVCFTNANAVPELPKNITVEITGKSVSENATVFTIQPDFETAASINPQTLNFIQDPVNAGNGIAVLPAGAVMIPADSIDKEITLKGEIQGYTYTAGSTISAANNVGATVTMSLDE